jgi:hypothetical protein
MENTDLGLAQVSQDQSICLEDFRRIVTEAYIAGYNEGLAKFMPETQPSLSEQELYYSNQRLLR